MGRRRRRIVLAFLGMPLAAVACSSFGAGDDPQPSSDGAAPSDATSDAGTDALALADGGRPRPDTKLGDPNAWETYTLPATPTTYPSGQLLGFGGLFDGRHVYLPGGLGRMARFDTTGARLDDPTAWGTFDVRTVDTGGPLGSSTYITLSPGVVGPDGKLYFPASFNSFTVLQQRSFRFDPKDDFADAASWEEFSTVQKIDGGSAPFSGAFRRDDGVVFLPFDQTATGKEAPPAIYAFATGTGAAFTSPGSWQTSALLGAGVDAQLTGAAVVGNYVYAGNAKRPEVARIDRALTEVKRFSTKPLFPPGSPGAATFGTSTDGRYVYFTPRHLLDSNSDSTATASGDLIRYDTTRPWGVEASYERFDLHALDPANGRFLGGTFDGRFVYFCSYDANRIVRYDTLAPFADRASYEGIDLTTLLPKKLLRNGLVFDGQYVYLVPTDGLDVQRFRARNTPLASASTVASSF